MQRMLLLSGSVLSLLFAALLLSFYTPENDKLPVSQEGFIGEVKLFAGNFAPRNWAYCDGKMLSVSQNQALFSILGTQYGGDGRTTFALPDLNGPLHAGKDFSKVPAKSESRGQKVNFTIKNKTGKEVEAFWVDFNGQLKFYGNISPGQTYEQLSGSGQVWKFFQDNRLVYGMQLRATPKQEYTIDPLGPEVRYIICLQGVYPSRS